ncbi:hypothetical protein Acsp04_24680 [Actinomadura sp. NBRC 104425]|uniref:hypothetical protein n=1 Tax=Actinomadura sp. NBRC 104425 TaxID=3032204 RepID=UPI0024A5407E|nr:hypothetical protein [Actinomadura sp. NBRC 104425]GLZ12233.1 hypothetical protein Acsp04_24680 [Actinomadura sp. NBRC 104425]
MGAIGRAVRQRLPDGAVPAARRHWPVAAVLAAGLAVRAVALAGYPTGLWFGDSVGYLRVAVTLEPSITRASAYGVMLLVLRPLHSLFAVVAVQHLLGLLTAVLLYALVWRHARAAWPGRTLRPGLLGAAATLPVLFDGYQIQLEHLLLSETLFTFLLVAAVVVLLWNARVGVRAAAAGGLLLGLAGTTRSVGLPLLAIVLAWLLVLRSGVPWRPAAVLVVSFAVPLLLYAAWFKVVHGRFALTGTEKVFLYSRTVDFADCSVIRPRPGLLDLCPRTPPPGVAPAFAVLWTRQSPFFRAPGGKMGSNERAGEFAWAAIRAQPADYARVVVRDTLRAFWWKRTVYPQLPTFRKYEFPARPLHLSRRQAKVARAYTHRVRPVRVVEPYAGWMRAYQHRVYLPGIGLGVMLAVAAVAMATGAGPARPPARSGVAAPVGRGRAALGRRWGCCPGSGRRRALVFRRALVRARAAAAGRRGAVRRALLPWLVVGRGAARPPARLGVAAPVGRGRAALGRRWGRCPGSGRRWALSSCRALARVRRGAVRRALLPWLVAVGLLVVPAATADFDYRYVLPAVPFGALSTVLAIVPPRRSG